MKVKNMTDDKVDEGSHSCPEGQVWDESAKKCVPKKADSIDNPVIVQAVKDSIAALGWEIPKENCDSLASLEQLYKFAKGNPKEKPKADSVDTPPELPASSDSSLPQNTGLPHTDAQERIITPPPTPKTEAQIKRDSLRDLFSQKIDSIIGEENVTAANYTGDHDKKLADHMDSLASALFGWEEAQEDFEITGSATDSTKNSSPKPEKSAMYHRRKKGGK
jgi:hypothetical protein